MSTEKNIPQAITVRVEQERLPAPVEELGYLSESERYAYSYFLAHRGQGHSHFPIAYSAQESLFQLYLNGRTCSEIRHAAPQFGLGQIVFACIDGQWEKRRQEHMQAIMERVGDRVRQVTVEGAGFAADLMSVTHVMWQDAVNQFLVTRDPKVLEDLGLGVGSVRTYKELVELLAKLTGQDQKKQVSGVIEHHHVAQPAPPALNSKSQLAAWAAERAAREAEKKR